MVKMRIIQKKVATPGHPHPDAGLPGFLSLQPLSGKLSNRGRSIAGYAASNLSLKTLSSPFQSLLPIGGFNLAISWPIAPEIVLVSKSPNISINFLLARENHSPVILLWA